MSKRRHSQRQSPIDTALAFIDRRKITLGLIAIFLGILLFAVSWFAPVGLPWRSYYNVVVPVDNSGSIRPGALVRIGGAQAGKVRSIEPGFTTDGKKRPIALLKLQLDGSTKKLPEDSTAILEATNILGLMAIEIVPGKSSKTVSSGGRLTSVSPNKTVSIDDIARAVTPEVGAALESTITTFGNLVAGRGAQLNRSIKNYNELIPTGLQVLRFLNDPDTGLPQAITGVDQMTSTLAPLGPSIAQIVEDTAQLTDALIPLVPTLGKILEDTPITFQRASRAIDSSDRATRDLLAISQDLAPIAKRIPSITNSSLRLTASAKKLIDPKTGVEPALNQATGIVRGLTPRVWQISGVVDRTSRLLPQLSKLITPMLAAERNCEAFANLMYEVNNGLSGGDRIGGMIPAQLVLDPQLFFESKAQAVNLHYDGNMKTTSDTCTAGNQKYIPGRSVVGPAPLVENPTVARHKISPASESLARKAGLLPNADGSMPWGKR